MTLGFLVGRYSRLSFIALSVFVLGLVIGLLAYGLLGDRVPDLVDYVYGGVLVDDDPLQTALNIFFRNTTATVITLVSGLLFIPPLIILFGNGLLAGIVLEYALARGGSPAILLWGIVPHGVIELPAFFLSAALGMSLSLSVIKPGSEGRFSSLKRQFKEAAAIYLTVVLPLLAVAALVEAYITSTIVL